MFKHNVCFWGKKNLKYNFFSFFFSKTTLDFSFKKQIELNFHFYICLKISKTEAIQQHLKPGVLLPH